MAPKKVSRAPGPYFKFCIKLIFPQIMETKDENNQKNYQKTVLKSPPPKGAWVKLHSYSDHRHLKGVTVVVVSSSFRRARVCAKEPKEKLYHNSNVPAYVLRYVYWQSLKKFNKNDLIL